VGRRLEPDACVEIQAFVKEMGEGDELPSIEATLSAYYFSLSLRTTAGPAEHYTIITTCMPKPKVMADNISVLLPLSVTRFIDSSTIKSWRS
jgi:hypothetical protein